MTRCMDCRMPTNRTELCRNCQERLAQEGGNET